MSLDKRATRAPSGTTTTSFDSRYWGGDPLLAAPMTERPECPERVVVAVRTEQPHDHIARVKFDDGTDESAEDAMTAIKAHAAHYVMRKPGLPLPLLLQVRQCPDCLKEVLWA